MKVRYFVTKGKNEYVSIYIRFWDSKRIDQKTKTGLVVLYNNWSDTKEQVKAKATAKQRDFINQTLRELKNNIIESYNLDYNGKVYIGNKWLKSKVNAFFSRSNENELYKTFFTDWIKRFNENAPKRLYKGKYITERTIKNYKLALNRLLDYENHINNKLRFEDINLSFYNDFTHYCKNEKGYNNNTIGSIISRVKFFCKQIELDGLPINPQYKHSDFITISNKTQDVYLTNDEINTIYNHDFSKSPRLDRVRDLFMIGLRTGLRISDFLRLQKIDIKKGFIQIVTTKTNEPVIIPLHPQVKTIIQKHNDEIPQRISNQKFNEYIKEVCKEVGITEKVTGAKINKTTKRKENGIYPKYELISSHTCRRSFASNLYGKLPNMVIMAITGHSSENVFLNYIKITKKEHAETLRKHWAKEEKEQGYSNVLRVVK